MIMMVASETFPAQIRQLRLQARLTQAELARRADVSRRTIIRWESAIVSPWIPELHKVLTALGVPEIDQAQVLSQITAPRAVQCCSDSETHTTYLLAKFLWSMRQRSGLSARSLARRVEVNASTIVRWESGQLLPSAEVVERLFEVLDVRELEREALGQMKQVRFLSEQPNPESLAAELSEDRKSVV